ncbi:MAG: glycosyltransferase family 39 protein [Chloroflexi bacterium]|nr:glycosyltransferase family 39 protein [Chloroflexota bacterium]
MSNANSAPARFNVPLTVRLILLAAFGARAFGLGAQSLWYDEAVSLFLARQPVADLIAHTAGDIHPPLYYLLLHYWLAWAGASEFAAAFFSLFFGVLMVAIGFRLARDWFGAPTAALAAFLLAISSFQLWYAQEIRMYTLAGSLVLLSLWLVERIWRAGFSVRRKAFWTFSAAYAATVALGLYTHYYFVFLWVAEFSYVAILLLIDHVAWRAGGRRIAHAFKRLRGRNRANLAPEQPATASGGTALAARRVWRAAAAIVQHPLVLWCVVQVGVIALFAPWLPTAVRQAIDPPVPPWRSVVALSDALAEAIYALAYGQSMPRAYASDLLVGLVLLLCVLALASTVRRPRGTDGRGIAGLWLLVLSTAVPFALIMLASARVPLFHVRYMFIFSGAFAIVAAAGLALIARRSPLVTVLLLGILLGGMAYADIGRRNAPEYAKDDYRSAVAYIEERIRPGDAILINAGYIYPAFVYYYRGPIAWRGRLTDYPAAHTDGLVVAQTGSLDASPNLGWGSAASDFYGTDETASAAALDQLLRDHPRLWVLRANDTVNDPHGFIRDYLAKNMIAVDEITVPGESYVKVQTFVARGVALNAFGVATVPGQAFSGRIELAGYAGPPTVTSDDKLDITLYWKALAPIDVDYHVSVGLYDARGRRWSAVDGVPVGRLIPTGDWTIGQVLPDAWRLHVPRGTPPGTYNVLVTLYDPSGGRPVPVANGVDGVRARAGQVQIARPASTGGSSLWPPRPVFGSVLALDRVELSAGPVKPGASVHAELLWNAFKTPAGDMIVGLTLVDDRGRQWAAQELAPVEGRYPASQWSGGEYVADSHDLPVPADVPNGSYHVMLALFAARNHEVLAARAGWWPLTADSIELGTVTIQGRERVMQAPASIGNAAHVRFGDSALLVGYDIGRAPAVAASNVLTATLYWQSLSAAKANYKVFVHVVGNNEQIVGQKDGEPGAGAYPMTGWIEGEYLIDSYRVELPPNLAAGAYTVYIGMYDPVTTTRLAIMDVDGKPAGDRWRLASLQWP